MWCGHMKERHGNSALNFLNWSASMKIGDLVIVDMKFHGPKKGIILKPWGHALGNAAWTVALHSHTTATTIASESDIKVINASR